MRVQSGILYALRPWTRDFRVLLSDALTSLREGEIVVIVFFVHISNISVLALIYCLEDVERKDVLLLFFFFILEYLHFAQFIIFTQCVAF